MSLINYLKGPELVAKIQLYFGVKPKVLTSSSTSSATTNNKLKISDNNHSCKKDYIITNKFWYYLFVFGTSLGDELFYISFIPFWFWNIDGAVGRRVVLIWAIVMFIGQSMKDVLCWPRPGRPVFRLQDKWSMEYGMPSTHAMVGVSIPFSIVLCTMHRYQYDVPLGWAAATAWCFLICLSRLYLGMHTVLDIIAGIVLAVSIMCPIVPLIDHIDNYLLTSPTSPFLLLVTSILMIVYYPNSDKWTPTRGDTTMILSVSVGAYIGAWLNYQTDVMSPSELTAPYTIMWPSLVMLGCTVLRTFIGFLAILLTRTVVKSTSYHFLCTLLREDVDSLKRSENTMGNRQKTIVELGCKYVTCGLIGFNIVYLLPQLFRFVRIERPTFFTEI